AVARWQAAATRRHVARIVDGVAATAYRLRRRDAALTSWGAAAVAERLRRRGVNAAKAHRTWLALLRWRRMHIERTDSGDGSFFVGGIFAGGAGGRIVVGADVQLAKAGVAEKADLLWKKRMVRCGLMQWRASARRRVVAALSARLWRSQVLAGAALRRWQPAAVERRRERAADDAALGHTAEALLSRLVRAMHVWRRWQAAQLLKRDAKRRTTAAAVESILSGTRRSLRSWTQRAASGAAARRRAREAAWANRRCLLTTALLQWRNSRAAVAAAAAVDLRGLNAWRRLVVALRRWNVERQRRRADAIVTSGAREKVRASEATLRRAAALRRGLARWRWIARRKTVTALSAQHWRLRKLAGAALQQWAPVASDRRRRRHANNDTATAFAFAALLRRLSQALDEWRDTAEAGMAALLAESRGKAVAVAAQQEQEQSRDAVAIWYSRTTGAAALRRRATTGVRSRERRQLAAAARRWRERTAASAGIVTTTRHYQNRSARAALRAWQAWHRHRRMLRRAAAAAAGRVLLSRVFCAWSSYADGAAACHAAVRAAWIQR
ncbi:unnamed protein product, partial [Phaeothamnion confervicola]